MNDLVLTKIFLRSFFISTTLNFRRMQNMGFAMTVIPAIREWNLTQKDAAECLNRHLQMFNTHPYFSASVAGSVVRLEEEQFKEKGVNRSVDSIAIKQVLAGPYAAIGDTFFWGALRPFAAIVSCVLAYAGYFLAPLAFLLLYTPAHVWVRLQGFLEGYRRGKQGIEFVRMLDLPRNAVNIRWGALGVLAGWAAFLINGHGNLSFNYSSDFIVKVAALATILGCIGLMKKRISQVYILYGAALIFLLISLKDFLN